MEYIFYWTSNIKDTLKKSPSFPSFMTAHRCQTILFSVFRDRPIFRTIKAVRFGDSRFRDHFLLYAFHFVNEKLLPLIFDLFPEPSDLLPESSDLLPVTSDLFLVPAEPLLLSSELLPVPAEPLLLFLRARQSSFLWEIVQCSIGLIKKGQVNYSRVRGQTTNDG